MGKGLEDIGNIILTMPNQVVCTYWEDKKIHSVGIDIDKDEHITVVFEKGYVESLNQLQIFIKAAKTLNGLDHIANLVLLKEQLL